MDPLNQIQLPNAKPLIVGSAQNLVFRFGKARPFKVEEQDTPQFNVQDKLGINWLTSVSFDYKNEDNKKEFAPFNFEECIMTINLEKNIVSTALQGRSGTIKEYVTQGDYSITMAAAISNYQEEGQSNSITEYPAEKLKKLKEFLDVEDSIKVHSQFLDYFGIRSVVIQKYNLTQETHSNRQSISITMLSDTPYEIKLKQEKDAKTV